MPPTFKSYRDIFLQQMASIQALFPGALFVQRSLLRAMVHANALQQADLHIQGERLLRAFSVDDAEGDDLDRRVAEAGVERLQSRVSRGDVQFGDGDVAAVTSGTLLAGLLAGTTTVTLNLGEGAAFSAHTPLGVLILGRATVSEEKISISTVVGDVVSLTNPTTFTHGIGETVYRGTSGSDRVVSSGAVVFVSGVLGTPDIEFLTLEDVTLLDGDIISSPVDIVSRLPGAGTVVAQGRIRSLASPPFASATVTNASATFGGRDVETDGDLVQRYKRRIQSLSKGTPIALEDAALGVELGGAQVVYARVVEPIGPGASRLYIDDGSGTLGPAYTAAPQYETPIFDSTPGKSFARLLNWPVNLFTVRLFKDVDRGVATGVGVLTLTDSSQSWVGNPYAVDHVLVDDQGGVWNILSSTTTTLTLQVLLGVSPGDTPSLGGYAIVDVAPASALVLFDSFGLPLTQPAATDKVLFDTTQGEFRLLPSAFPTGMDEHGALVAVDYSYATGLIQEVARVTNGDPVDRATYPGARAAGTIVRVEVPTIVNLSFTISISVELGFTEPQLSPFVVDAVVQYVNSRGIRNNTVYLSEVIRRVKSIEGIRDTRVISPTQNPTLAENELPRTDASLITVV